MYFWNIKALNKDLKEGLTQKEDFKYLLAYEIMWLSILFFPNELGIFDIVTSLVEVILAIITIFVLYKINGGANGKNFLSKYLSISFVAVIRSLVFIFIPLILMLAIFVVIFYGQNVPEETGIDAVIFTIIYGVLYLYLCRKYFVELVESEK